MKITILELTKIYTIIKETIFSSFDIIEISSDYYWHISSDERENMNKKPELCAGSLNDDWQELKLIPQRGLASLVDVDRFANILISISEAILQKNSLVNKNIDLNNAPLSAKTNSSIKISIQEVNLIYPYIEKAILLIAGNEIELLHDAYWTTLPQERERILDNPTIDVGALNKDWQELQKMHKTKLATVTDITRFANILITTGEAVLHKSSIL